jgi:hypothetical protein
MCHVDLKAVHVRVHQGLVPRLAAERLHVGNWWVETLCWRLRDPETSWSSETTGEAAPPKADGEWATVPEVQGVEENVSRRQHCGAFAAPWLALIGGFWSVVGNYVPLLYWVWTCCSARAYRWLNDSWAMCMSLQTQVLLHIWCYFRSLVYFGFVRMSAPPSCRCLCRLHVVVCAAFMQLFVAWLNLSHRLHACIVHDGFVCVGHSVWFWNVS